MQKSCKPNLKSSTYKFVKERSRWILSLKRSKFARNVDSIRLTIRLKHFSPLRHAINSAGINLDYISESIHLPRNFDFLSNLSSNFPFHPQPPPGRWIITQREIILYTRGTLFLINLAVVAKIPFATLSALNLLVFSLARQNSVICGQPAPQDLRRKVC